MQRLQPRSDNANGYFRLSLRILAGYPVLAIVLVIAASNDLLPTDYYGRPTVLSWVGIYIILSVPVFFLIRCFVPLFSRKFRAFFIQHKWIDALWTITSLIFFFGILIPGTGHPNPKSRFMRDWRTKMVVNQIYTGMLAYKSEYGNLPATSNNRELINELQGNNPRQLAFINFKGWETNSVGEAIDGYETPIRISVVNSGTPVVKSAGPDRIWNTSDDQTGDTDFR